LGLNWRYALGVDGISLFFIVLTSFIIPTCLLVIWKQSKIKEFVVLILMLEFFLLSVFSVLDLLWFFVFFEAVLMPMFLIIGYWGSGIGRIKAAYWFILYTLVGSVFVLFGIMSLYLEFGSTNFMVLLNSDICWYKQFIFF